MARWFVWRNGGIDIDGEWQPSDSWSATKEILPGVVCRVSILGEYCARRFGLSAYRWYGTLSVHGWGYEIKSSHPSCKSVKDALRYADRELTSDFVCASLRHFYRAKSRATCIDKIDKSGERTPFLTWLGESVDWMAFDYGEYIAAHRSPRWETDLEKTRIAASKVERFSHGYAGSGEQIDDPPSWAWQ